ncbi:MAG TPA: outer membrane beta-barrel protein [Longimicrobium sp.]|nr:outer membrane beta-barrel protein [Longimicrobium sp.]
MKKTTFALAALAAVAFTGTQANAQSALPLSFEVRGGAAIPTGDFGDLASTGFGLNGNVTFNVTPVVGIYGGYTLNRFGINDDLGELGDDVTLTEQGFDVGLKARFASPTGLPVTPFFRGGAIFHKLSIDEDFVDPGEDNETDMKLGFEVGGGVEVGLSRNITLTPQVGYSQFNPSEDDDTDDDDIDVSNINVGVGINIRL